MMKQAPLRPPLPTLADTLQRFVRARFFMGYGALAGLALAVIFLLALNPHYRVTMVVATPPPLLEADQNDDAQTPTSHAARVFDVYRSVLIGPDVAQVLWADPETHQHLRGWRSLVHQAPLGEGSTPEDVVRFLKDHITLDPPGLTRTVRVMMLAADPAAARTLLLKLHMAANRYIADLDAQEFSRANAQDRAALNRITETGLRRTLADRIRWQESMRIRADGAISTDYAAQLIASPFATPDPVAPPRLLTLLVCAMVGLLAGYILFAIRHPYALRPDGS